MNTNELILRHPDGRELTGLNDACEELVAAYGDLCVGEAMTRAFVAERTEKRQEAFFWISVYKQLANKHVGNLTILDGFN